MQRIKSLALPALILPIFLSWMGCASLPRSFSDDLLTLHRSYNIILGEAARSIRTAEEGREVQRLADAAEAALLRAYEERTRENMYLAARAVVRLGEYVNGCKSRAGNSGGR